MFGIYTVNPSLQAIASSNVVYENRSVVGSATCIAEMNKAGSLEFTIYQTHPLFNSLHKMRTIVQAEMDGHVIFRGRVLNSETNIFNQRTIYCEGDLAFLLDSVQEPGEYEETISEFLTRIIDSHNLQVDANRGFKMGTVNVGGAEVRKFVIDSYQSTWNVIENLLLSEFGGYLRTHVDANYAYIDYMENYYKKASQSISFGTNIVDLTEYIPGEDFFTVLLPIGNDGMTIAEVNNDNIYIENQDLIREYGRITKIQQFNNVVDATDLLNRANAYFNENNELPYNFQVTAVDLGSINPNVETMLIGDVILVSSGPHLLHRDLVCKKITYNLLYPERNIYELGKKIDDFSEKYTSGSRNTNSKIDNVKNETASSIEASKEEFEKFKTEITKKVEDLQLETSGDVSSITDKIDDILSGKTIVKILNAERVVLSNYEGVWKKITYVDPDGETHEDSVLVSIKFEP